MHRSRNILRRTALSAAAVIVFGGIALAGADPALGVQPVASMATTATHATHLRSGDAINGMVVELSRELGLDAPYNQTLCALLRARESRFSEA